MGTYNYNKEMLIEELIGFLDDIEGDFNREDLRQALLFCLDYGFCIDSKQHHQRLWKERLRSQRIGSDKFEDVTYER